MRVKSVMQTDSCIASSGLSPTQYQYTGQYSHTADFGLMYYCEASLWDNARWYDPALGRFAQADSIVPPGVQGYDRYAYVNNNPMRFTDPTGHFPIIPIIGLIGMAVALSQVPSDVPQTDPANWGNENVFWAGMSVNPVVDFVVSTVQCVTSGCDPVTYSMTALPGPNPKTIANAVDNIAEDSTQIINPLPERELPNFVSGDAIPNIYGEGTNLYRVHSPGGEYKNWWTTEPPTSELQWRIDQAVLPEWNTGEKISVLTVPSGEQIGGWAGFASYKGGFYVGGGNQVYLPRVPSRWIKTMDFTEFNRHNSGR